MAASSDLPLVPNAYYVPTSRIEANPWQPRQHFDAAALDELAQSIRAHGLLQPVLLRPHPTKADWYQLVSGERRWRACQLIERAQIPAIVRALSDLEARQLALQENIQRASLTDWEEARGIEGLWQEYERSGEPMSKREMARRLGMSVSYVSNRLDALGYHSDVQNLLERRRGALSSARLINAVGTEERRRKYIELVDGGKSFSEVARVIEADRDTARAKTEAHRAPDAQTGARLAQHEKGDGGGGALSRGELLTGPTHSEANSEVRRALRSLESWLPRADEEVHDEAVAVARRILRGSLARD